MKDFTVPDEFKSLLSSLAVYDARSGQTLTEHLTAHASSQNKRNKETLRIFLDELLGGKYTAAELKRVWKYTPDPNYTPRLRYARDTVTLLREIRRALSES